MATKTGLGTAGLLEDLRGVMERREPVRIERRRLERKGSHTEGFVVDVSPTLVLLNTVTDRIDLDGFEIIRVRDVTTLWTDWSSRSFIERALELKGLTPASPAAPIDLESMRAAVVSAAAAYPMIVVDREKAYPGEVAIGRLREEVRFGFRMHWMSVAARWEWDDELYRWSEVTRLGFDGEYERTLALVAEADGAELPTPPADEE